MENLIVGDQNCSINSIVVELEEHECYAELLQKWRGLARRLDTPSSLMQKLSRDMLLDTKSIGDVIISLLEDWKSRNAREAKLSVLLDAIENCQLNAIADHLRNKYQWQSWESEKEETLDESKHTVNKSMFIKPPPYMEEFLKNELLTVVCVWSNDCELTCKRILDTVPYACRYNSNDFLMLISEASSTVPMMKSLPVVLCDKDLKRIIALLSDIVGKCALISTKLQITNHNFAITTVEDKFSWTDLSPLFQKEIQTKCANLINLPADKCLKVLPRLEYEELLQITHGKIPQMFRDNMPEDITYYIPRRLRSRYILNEDIFSYEGRDIFFIHGIDRIQLSDLVNGRETDTSSNILSNSLDPTIKFVVLEELTHFEQITNKYEFNNYAKHLVNYDNGQLVWKKSTGGIQTIQQLVSANANQSILGEEKILKPFIDDPQLMGTVCISDSPGMGKSILLGNLARKLKASQNDGLLSVFVSISELAEQFITERNETSNSKSIISAMGKCLCQNELATAYFEHHREMIKDIFLDGLDEWNSNKCDGYELIKLVQKYFSGSRIWVATRPHMLIDLERALNVIGYNIEPFEEEDQIQFLKKFWSRKSNADVNFTNLTDYATKCLSVVKKTILNTKNDNDVVGIPLQCLLIGEVYEDGAISVMNSEHESMPIMNVESVTDLYDKLVVKKYENFRKKFMTTLDDSVLTKAHIQLSLSLIFPSFFQQLDKARTKPAMSNDEVLNVGIVEDISVHWAPRFIQRTFAEYFVAKYMADFTLGNFLESEREFLLRKVFETSSINISERSTSIGTWHFKYNVICYFINALLSKNKDFNSVSKVYRKYGPSVNVELLKDISEACAYSDFDYILFMIICNLAHSQNLEPNIFNTKLLFVSTLCSRKSLAKKIFHKFNELNNEDTVYSDLRFNEKTLFYFAVSRGESEIFDVVINLSNFPELLKSGDELVADIIHECVERTGSLDMRTVQSKCEVVKRLHKINPKLVTAKPTDKNLPIQCLHVHIELLLLLLELGRTYYELKTLVSVLHNATFIYDSRDYLKLLKNFKYNYPKEFLKQLLNESLQGYTLVERIIPKLNPTVSILDFLNHSEISFESKSLETHSVLQLAIEGKTNLSCIRWLLCNLLISNPQLENAFWHAHKCQYFEFLKLAIESKQISPNTSDNSGLTSLHLTCVPSVFQNNRFPITKKQVDYIETLITYGADTQKIHPYTGWRAVEYLVDTMPSVQGFKILDILESSKAVQKRAFQKWKWLVRSEKVDELDFGDCARICAKEIANLNAKDSDGNTFLHFVAEAHNLTALKYLIARGINVDVTNKEGESPLDLAVKKVDKECVKNFRHQDLKTIIIFSCNNCKSKTINFFCAWYALVWKQSLSDITLDLEGSPSLLKFAISTLNGDLLEFFIEDESCTHILQSFPSHWIHDFVQHQNHDVEAVKFVKLVSQLFDNFISTQSEEGLVPLSVKGIKWEWVKPLVKMGANVNATDMRGNTPLHWAFKNKSQNLEHLVRDLIECGADVNWENQDEESPILLAAKSGNGYCVKLILDNKDFKLELQQLKTVIMCIFCYCDMETIKYVSQWYTRETGEEIKKISGEFKGMDCTLLDIALVIWEKYIPKYFLNKDTSIYNPSDYKIIHEILKKEPDDNDMKCATLVKWAKDEFWNTPNENGLVPLSIKGINAEWVKILVEFEADVNHLDMKGNTPLHWAVQHDQKNSISIVSQLLKYGANVCVKNNDNKTPVQVAAEKKRRNCLNLLLDNLFKNLKLTNITQEIFYICKFCDLDTIKHVCDWYIQHTKKTVKNLSIKFDEQQTTILDIAILRWEEVVLQYFLEEHLCTKTFLPFSIIRDKIQGDSLEHNDKKCASLIKRYFHTFCSVPEEEQNILINKSENHQQQKKDGPQQNINYERSEESFLGEGSRGTKVYKGTFKNQPAAIKVTDFQDKRIAYKELELLSKLDHQNIIKMFGYEERGEFVLLALELAMKTLEDWTTDEKCILPAATNSISIFKDVSHGLKYLHEQRVIHRDLKPENILLVVRSLQNIHEVSTKLADFGISKLLDPDRQSKTITKVIGTEAWLAPELLKLIDERNLRKKRKQGEHQASTCDVKDKMTNKVDIFSLGCIFYYVLSQGDHPFGDTDHSVNIKNNIRRDETFIDLEHYPLLFQNLGFLNTMMSHNPDDRPTAEKVLNHALSMLG